MSRFAVLQSPIAGLKLIERKSFGDSRGIFSRIFCAEELSTVGWGKHIVQVNHSFTRARGSVRGLHYQRPPHAEMKLVSCLHGAIWDVAVDLRTGSPTFLSWHAEEISAFNQRAFLIPEGFAHGFQTLTDNCELIYLHSSPYVPEAEAGISPQDPALLVDWPLEISEMSDRDAQHPVLSRQFKGVVV